MLEDIKISTKILMNIQNILINIFNSTNNNNINVDMYNKLLECSRKIDKIILYSLHSISTNLQYNEILIQILKIMI